MPELPEVEHAARRLANAALGKELTGIRALHPAIVRGLTSDDVARAVGREVRAVERRGKYQLLHLTGDVVVVAHFRMTGDWHAGPIGEPPPYTRAALEFSDGSAVYLVDSRALATIAVRPAGDERLPTLGIDAASPALTGQALRTALRGRRGAIKPLLLDQRVVAGLGNIYAAESLWRARISPFVPPGSIDDVDLDALAGAITETLALAADDPGRYARAEAVERLAVYGREGKPCPRCETAIARVVQAGRSTYYCPTCQAQRPGRVAPPASVSPAPRPARP